jgi:hypothetical protein
MIMKNKSSKKVKDIASRLIATLEEDSCVDILDLDGHSWFNADELYHYLNGNRICCNLPDGHKLYRLNSNEYLVYDIERRPTVYVNELGAMKMLHNIVSPVTVGIFEEVGLDRLKQIIENKSLTLAM